MLKLKTKILIIIASLCLFIINTSMAVHLQLSPSLINGDLSLSYFTKDSFWSSPIKMVSQAVTFIDTSKLGTENNTYLVKFESDSKTVPIEFTSGSQYCTPYKVGELLINKDFTDKTGNVALLFNYDNNKKFVELACAPYE